MGLLYDELMERACLDRIASDARVIAERDAWIAELERQIGVISGDCVVAHNARHKAERDAAWRALREREEKVAAGCSEGGTVQRNPTGDARYHADAERPDQPAVSSPAPIPLGAVVEVEGHPDSPLTRVADGWKSGRSYCVYADLGSFGPIYTALYRARHPVATRETVERVAERMFKFFCVSLPNGWALIHDAEREYWFKFARAALSAAGFTLEEGA